MIFSTVMIFNWPKTQLFSSQLPRKLLSDIGYQWKLIIPPLLSVQKSTKKFLSCKLASKASASLIFISFDHTAFSIWYSSTLFDIALLYLFAVWIIFMLDICKIVVLVWGRDLWLELLNRSVLGILKGLSMNFGAGGGKWKKSRTSFFVPTQYENNITYSIISHKVSSWTRALHPVCLSHHSIICRLATTFGITRLVIGFIALER